MVCKNEELQTVGGLQSGSQQALLDLQKKTFCKNNQRRIIGYPNAIAVCNSKTFLVHGNPIYVPPKIQMEAVVKIVLQCDS